MVPVRNYSRIYRTFSSVLCSLWSYVIDTPLWEIIYCQKLSTFQMFCKIAVQIANLLYKFSKNLPLNRTKWLCCTQIPRWPFWWSYTEMRVTSKLSKIFSSSLIRLWQVLNLTRWVCGAPLNAQNRPRRAFTSQRRACPRLSARMRCVPAPRLHKRSLPQDKHHFLQNCLALKTEALILAAKG